MKQNDYRNEMREARQETAWTIWHWLPVSILVLIILMGLGWLIQGNDFFMYKFFAPKQEQVRRQVFEQTKSYNQGMIQELQNMQFQYEQADSKHKDALASIILHRAADYPENKMPNNLKVFVQNLRREQSSSEINRGGK